MTGLVGIVGDGSLAELRTMAARMAYRGTHVNAWSPVSGVYLAEVGHSDDFSAGGVLALDSSGALYPQSGAAEPADNPRERLARALSQDADSALLELRGSYSFAFLERDGSVLLACDRHCYKTLYYIELPGRVAFASDYKALLALAECPAAVDRDTLQTYLLTLECPEDRALLQQVKPLAAARLLRIGRGPLQPRRYWIRQRSDSGLGFDASARELRRRLEAVVTQMTAGHQRIGLTLSGGLDSAALLGLVRSVRPDLEVAGYTVGYGPKDPEIRGAQEAARHFGIEHHVHIFDVDALPQLLPPFIWLTEDLMGREETLLQHAITRELATRERAFMAGNGADLDFCGMPRHRLLWLRNRAPRALRGALDELFVYTQIKTPPRSMLGRALVRMAIRSERFDAPAVPGAAAPHVHHDFSTLETYQRDTMADKPFCYHEPLDAQLDLTMMAPFSAPEIFEFALACPITHMIDRRRQKQVLRAAVADLLPPSLSGRSKAVQRLRYDQKLSDAVDSLAVHLELDRALQDRGLVAKGYVARLRSRAADSAYSQARLHTIWPLISAEIWMRQFVDNRGAPL
jgi:asparagine synthase (glutamine-hydrolysing)